MPEVNEAPPGERFGASSAADGSACEARCGFLGLPTCRPAAWGPHGLPACGLAALHLRSAPQPGLGTHPVLRPRSPPPGRSVGPPRRRSAVRHLRAVPVAQPRHAARRPYCPAAWRLGDPAAPYPRPAPVVWPDLASARSRSASVFTSRRFRSVPWRRPFLAAPRPGSAFSTCGLAVLRSRVPHPRPRTGTPYPSVRVRGYASARVSYPQPFDSLTLPLPAPPPPSRCYPRGANASHVTVTSPCRHRVGPSVTGQSAVRVRAVRIHRWRAP
ncbi:hypothetical protein RKD18_004019 [Streptomyces phaeoluteigriseus]